MWRLESPHGRQFYFSLSFKLICAIKLISHFNLLLIEEAVNFMFSIIIQGIFNYQLECVQQTLFKLPHSKIKIFIVSHDTLLYCTISTKYVEFSERKELQE